MQIDTRGVYAFLGTGHLARLISEYDWSRTPLGPIEEWGTALKISVSIALRSPVPIVMLFGEDGIMIYNDAYSVFAGQRHPELLGSKVREGWGEVADFNDNVMKVVLGQGKTLAYRDQELTLVRNGVGEPVWMDLDYSPIVDEAGTPFGVIAIVVETTGRVKAERWREGESERFQRMFEQAPGFIAMLHGPDHVFQMANAAHLQLVGHRDVVGQSVKAALPEVADQGFVELLDTVYATGEPFIGRELPAMLQRRAGGEAEQCYLDLIYQPVRDPDGKVIGIFVEGADVTERVLNERALRAQEAQFRTFAEAMPNHVWTARPDGQLDWFNSRVYQYCGVQQGALDGSGWAQIVHPEDRAAAGEAWAESVKTGNPYEVQFRLRRHDGTYRWHIARAVALPDAQGQIGLWLGTNTDIDDEKRIAEALAESDARLKLAIEAGQLAVWELDIANQRVTPSVALNRMYGFADDARPSSEDYQARYAPGELERLTRIGQQAAAEGRSDVEVEIWHLWPDGTEKCLLVRAQSVDHGKRAIGVVIDITERKRVEQKLIESESRFRLSQEAARIASLELDIESGKVIGSDLFWELWGLPKLESVDIGVLERIVVPEDRAVRSTEATRRDGTAVPSVEYRIIRPDNGQLRWLLRHIEFVHDPATGRPVKMFGIVQDVTLRKEAEARQQLLTHELEHRIKNILAMVSAIAAQTFRNTTDLPEASAALSKRLSALAAAHDILTKSRWTTASIGDVTASATSLLPAEQVSFEGPEVALEPKMALSLALAVNELGTNALKYGALATPDGRVDIGWSVDAGRLVWRWQETGGAAVDPPKRKGFGRFLIERVLAADFAGQVIIDYRPSGVVCTLSAPLPAAGTSGALSAT
jgi:PAS domain S-box-containing protein